MSKNEIQILKDEDLYEIILQMKKYVKFKASIFTRLFASYLPAFL
jgi:hypothetical protein